MKYKIEHVLFIGQYEAYETYLLKSLNQACLLSQAMFKDDNHVMVKTMMSAYNSLHRKKEEKYFFGISEKRAVYLSIIESAKTIT